LPNNYNQRFYRAVMQQASAFAGFRWDTIRTEWAFLKPEVNGAAGCGHSQPCAQ